MLKRIPNVLLKALAIPSLAMLAACQSTPHDALALRDPSAIDRIIDEYVGNGSFPVLYVRLEDRDGAVVYEHAATNPALYGDTAVDGQTWFRIWSMSKIVTISVVLDLEEDGVLSLQDPVTKYIPEFESLKVAVAPDGSDLSAIEDKSGACPLELVPVEREMTVLDLVNHEAGFYYTWTGIPCLDEPLADANLATSRNSGELIERVAQLPLILQPGTTDYYGINTTVLGVVAERASGKSLKQLVAERVTGPLGIQGLQYGMPDSVELLPIVSGQSGELRLANPGELDIFGQDLPSWHASSELYLGGEGMVATTDGYADFIRMLLNRGALNGYRYLDDATITELSSPHTQLDSEFGYNGYNLWVNNGKLADGSQGVGGLWIGGGYEGTHFWIDHERGFVGLVMSQIFWVPKSGYNRDETIREAIYDQLPDS